MQVHVILSSDTIPTDIVGRMVDGKTCLTISSQLPNIIHRSRIHIHLYTWNAGILPSSTATSHLYNIGLEAPAPCHSGPSSLKHIEPSSSHSLYPFLPFPWIPTTTHGHVMPSSHQRQLPPPPWPHVAHQITYLNPARSSR